MCFVLKGQGERILGKLSFLMCMLQDFRHTNDGFFKSTSVITFRWGNPLSSFRFQFWLDQFFCCCFKTLSWRRKSHTRSGGKGTIIDLWSRNFHWSVSASPEVFLISALSHPLWWLLQTSPPVCCCSSTPFSIATSPLTLRKSFSGSFLSLFTRKHRWPQKRICPNANQTTMRYEFTPPRTAIIKKTDNRKCWWRYGEIGTL